jgi:hypothetical protein
MAHSYKTELARLHKQLLAAEQRRPDEATVEARKTLLAAQAAINAEYETNVDAVEGDVSDLTLNPDNAKYQLEEAYDELITLFKQELKKASAERQPSADRTI